jgi:hypothetical protein
VRRALFVFGLVGCYDPYVPASGGGGDDGVDAGPADLDFTEPVKVAELGAGGSSDYGTTVDAAGTLVVINSDRVGNHKLWTATRAASEPAFGPATPVVGTDMAGGEEYDAELSVDGLEMHYHSTVNWPGLRRVTRATREGPWSAPEVLPEGRDREGPSLALDDLRMVNSGSTDGGIEEYARPERGKPWELVRAHPALGAGRWPAISSDGLEIFVIDEQRDQPLRLLRAVRSSIDEPFGAVQRVVLRGIGNAAVSDPELSPDGRTLYLSIERAADFDVYRCTR